MASVNKVILVGNLRPRSGNPLLAGRPGDGHRLHRPRPASGRTRRPGRRKEETEWHRVTFFGRMAEIAGEYLKKGHSVYVEGRLKYGKFTNKDGVEQNTCDIIATEMQLLGGREGRGGPSGGDEEGGGAPRRSAPRAAPAPAPAAQRPAAAKPASGFDDMDDDIPF